MTRFIAQRIVGAIPVLLLVTLITFALMRMIPGDPAAALGGLSATPQEREQIRHDLGLDQPYHVQLVRWYAGLAHGDLGRSILLGTDVLQATLERLPVTLSLSAYALGLTVLFGLTLGIFAALRQNSWVDQAAMMFAMLGISLPSFWLGLMMIVLFAVQLGWLPTGGYVNFTDDPWGWLRSTTMPAISLAALQMGLLTRITRSTMLEVLRQDYVRTARAKGLDESRVVTRHVLRNALLPMVTLIGLQAGTMLGGSVVVESVFSLPGLGRLAYESVVQRDLNTLLGIVFVSALLVIIVNFAVDLLYARLDPRIAAEG
jgi:peptide/nickel transport system permease protein